MPQHVSPLSARSATRKPEKSRLATTPPVRPTIEVFASAACPASRRANQPASWRWKFQASWAVGRPGASSSSANRSVRSSGGSAWSWLFGRQWWPPVPAASLPAPRSRLQADPQQRRRRRRTGVRPNWSRRPRLRSPAATRPGDAPRRGGVVASGRRGDVEAPRRRQPLRDPPRLADGPVAARPGGNCGTCQARRHVQGDGSPSAPSVRISPPQMVPSVP